MSLTTWGYTITADTYLPDLISEEEYNDLTASRFSGDARIAPNLSAVSAAIRNYCGWHIYPAQPCQLEVTLFDRRVTRVRGGIMIQLPARFVTAVTSVTVGGSEVTSYTFDPTGLVRIYGAVPEMEWTPVVVAYTAGLCDSQMSAIKELAAHRVSHALAASYGVTSESSGGVSVSYSSNWINGSRSTALADDNKEVLAPYRLQEVL